MALPSEPTIFNKYLIIGIIMVRSHAPAFFQE